MAAGADYWAIGKGREGDGSVYGSMAAAMRGVMFRRSWRRGRLRTWAVGGFGLAAAGIARA